MRQLLETCLLLPKKGLPLLVTSGLSALMPLALFWSIGNLVDSTLNTLGCKSLTTAELLLELLPSIGLFAVVTYLTHALNTVTSYLQTKATHTLRANITHRIQKQTASLSYQTLQSPQFQSKTYRSITASTDRPIRIFLSTISLAQSLITLVSLGIWLSTLKWYLPLLVIAAGLPILLTRLDRSTRTYQLHVDLSDQQRKLNYYNRLLTAHHYAPEVRTYNLTAYLKELYQSTQKALAHKRLAHTTRTTRNALIALALSTLLVVATFLLVILLVANGGLSVGSLAMYLMTIRRTDSAARDVVSRSVNLHTHSLYLKALNEYLNYKDAPQPSQPFPQPFTHITFRNVSFSYPDSERQALANLNLTIRQGETVAIAGKNGAGKSTIVKLLSGLLRPTTGETLINNTPINDIDRSQLVANITTLFQDFNIYSATVAENIWFGGSNEPLDNCRLETVARLAGIDELISHLPDGYQTQLGNQFPGSENISRGEWQRLALARVLYSHAPIVILDEPASSLDPSARKTLTACLQHLKDEGRTVVIISHIEETLELADRKVEITSGEE